MLESKLLIIDIDFIYAQLDSNLTSTSNSNSLKTSEKLISIVLDLATIIQPTQVIFLSNLHINSNTLFSLWCREVTPNIFNNIESIQDIIFTCSSDAFQQNIVHNPNRPRVNFSKVEATPTSIAPSKQAPRVYVVSEPKNVYTSLIFPTTNLLIFQNKNKLYSNENFLNDYGFQPQYWLDFMCLFTCEISDETTLKKFLIEVGSISRVFEYFNIDTSSIIEYKPFSKPLTKLSSSALKIAKIMLNNQEKIVQTYTILKPKLIPKLLISKKLNFYNGNDILVAYGLHSIVSKSLSLNGKSVNTKEPLL